MKIEHFPLHVQAQIREKLNREDAAKARRLQSSDLTLPTTPEEGDKALERSVVVRRGPNKTEAEYNRTYLREAGRYEAITLRLPGGSRYTADWVTAKDGLITLHEVKGSYRFASQGRALTAWREAVAAFPEFTFVWAVKQKGGVWKIETSK